MSPRLDKVSRESLQILHIPRHQILGFGPKQEVASIKAIQSALTAQLSKQLHIPAVADRALCRTRPILVVAVEEGGITLLAGGTQAEHCYKVTITAVSDRDRSGTTELVSRLTPVLLGGIPMENRVLHPTDIRTKDETVTCQIALCIPIPQTKCPTGEPGMMEHLHLEL